MTDKKNDNVALRDKELFDKISTKYVKKDLDNTSKLARKLRLIQTLRKTSLNKEIDILEVGCGGGFSSEYLKGNYSTFTGIDYSKKLIDYANNRNKDSNVSFLAVDLFDFKNEKKYDLIFMIGVLHHMVDIKLAIENCCSLLKPNGYLAVNEPQPANILFSYLRSLRSKVDNDYSSEQEEFTSFKLRKYFNEASLMNVSSFPQGFFSTPFAEVVMNPQEISTPVSKVACYFDELIENKLNNFVKNLTWNVIVIGQNKIASTQICGESSMTNS